MPSGYRFGVETRRAFFDLICTGTPIRRAARQAGVSQTCAFRWWAEAGPVTITKGNSASGAVFPCRPDQPGGKGHRLNLVERIAIMRGRDAGSSFGAIGRSIGRDKSVVYREVQRNSNPDGSYHALLADCRAAERAQRPKEFTLATSPQLCAKIEAWMDQGWSPRLIATVLRRDHPHDKAQTVSHETIYQCLYVQARGGLRADLCRQLSTRRTARKPRGTITRRGRFYDEAFKISDRPAEVAAKAVPGHWEGDLLMGGTSKGAIGTLVERTTKFTLLLHLPHGHGPDQVAAAMIATMGTLPDHLRRSLTWDRGMELQRYRTIQLDLTMPVYFCNPHSPWQRGLNENTNRLLRFWFEKGCDFRGQTAADLRRVQDLLNQRPRPSLDLDTPAQRLAALIEQSA